MEPVYVEKFVTFANFGNGWQMFIWESKPDAKHYRLRVLVPDELLAPIIEVNDSALTQTHYVCLAAEVEKVVAEKDAQWTKTNAEYERVSKALSKCQAELACVKADNEQLYEELRSIT